MRSATVIPFQLRPLPPVPRGTAKAGPGAEPAAPLRVLVIDDSPEDRMVVRHALEAEGFTLMEAALGEDGLATARALRPDCVLLDWHLPDYDGLEMLDALKVGDDAGAGAGDKAGTGDNARVGDKARVEDKAGVGNTGGARALPCAVVVFTGGNDAAEATEGLRAGALDYVSKQRMDRDSLRRAIHGAVERFRLTADRRAAEERNAQLAAIVDSTADAIVSIGFDTLTIRTWNGGAEGMFGYAEAEAIGRRMEDLVLPPDRRGEREAIHRAVRDGGHAAHLETVRLHRDGHPIHVDLTASPMLDAAGATIGLSLVFRDIGARKAAEARAAAIRDAFAGSGHDHGGSEMLAETLSLPRREAPVGDRMRGARAAGLWDDRRDPAIDRITQLAAGVLQAPVSLMTTTDGETLFLVSERGLAEPLRSTRKAPFRTAYCRHVLGGQTPVVIGDAEHHPLVADDEGWRTGFAAYLGVPIRDRGGMVVGSLCVTDSAPRAWTRRDLQALEGIARLLDGELESRAAARDLAASAARLQRVQRIGRVGGFEIELAADELAPDELAPDEPGPDQPGAEGDPLTSTIRRTVAATDPSETLPDGIAPPYGEIYADWLRRIHPDDRAQAERRYHAAIARGAGTDYAQEYRIVPASGEIRWISVRGEVERDDRGCARMVRGVSVDVTDLKATEAALRARSAELEALLTSAPLGVAFFDRSHRYLRINETLAAINGVPMADHAGRTLEEVLPGVAHGVGSAIDRVFATGEAIGDLEVTGETPLEPGVIRHWLTGFYPVRGPGDGTGGGPGDGNGGGTGDGTGGGTEGGEIESVGAWVTEITARKRVEESLRESEALFRTITDAMPHMVWSTRPDGQRDFANARWHEFTGAPAGAHDGDGWMDAIHPDDLSDLRARWRTAMGTGEAYEHEYRLRRHDGEYRRVLVRALPLRDAAGAITRWLGSSTDVTEIAAARDVLDRDRAALEAMVGERTRDLRESQTRVAHLQRMEALGQLAGGIAHDFNNVLQAVQGGASLIERRLADPEAVRRLARMVFEAAARGAGVTRRLLSFSRSGDLRAEAVDAAALLAGLGDVLTHTLGAGIDVRVEAEESLPPMLVDKGQLETVLVNLATNARDAMAGSGALTLSAAVEEVGAGPARPGRPGAGSYVRLSVADTGAGMAPEVLARVTEPFFTTKGPGRGTGLGLAMAKGFAEQSGGALAIDSAPERGTTIRLWLPVSGLSMSGLPGSMGAAEAAASLAPNPAWGPESRAASGLAETPEAKPKRPRLLVVDDEPLVRGIMAEELEAAGHAVVSAPDGPAALALLDAGEAVDLLLSDLSMPGMDGVTLVREARRRRPRLPAILLTGFASNAAEIAMADVVNGTFILLRKPIDTATLAERVAVLLEGVAAGEAAEK